MISDIIIRDNNLKPFWIASFRDKQLGKHEIMRLDISNSIRKIINKILFAKREFWEIKMEILVSESALSFCLD
jgi:hypothetical protein